MFYEKLVLRNVGEEQKPQVVGLLENGEPNSLLKGILGIPSVNGFMIQPNNWSYKPEPALQ